MGGTKIIRHNRLGLCIKMKIYRDIDYVEGYYNLCPYFYDFDWDTYVIEDSDDLIKV